MTERTRFGNSLFGVPGMYVSQPDDDISNPTKALLLDSRYDALEIHTRGRVSIPAISENAGLVSYQRTINFPSLGYVPQITWGVVMNSGQNIYYPPGRVENGNGNPFYTPDVAAHLTDSSFTYRNIVPTPAASLDLFYVIYRNPRQSVVLPPAGTERVFIGSDAGTFKMRVSKPGYWARAATRDQCFIHEDKRPLIPVASGTVTMPPNGGSGESTTDVGLGISFAFPPKVITRHPVGGQVACRLSLSSGILRFYNSSNASVPVKYVIYNPE